jgi:ATP-dependent DNA helicase RecQ
MENYRQILTHHWGYSEFRPLQREIIDSVAAGNDTLGLMPTGGGKSITFQVYSLSRGGKAAEQRH